MPQSNVCCITICYYPYRQEEEQAAGISEEEKKSISSFATKHGLSESVLLYYYVSAKRKTYSENSKVNSSCPEKIAMVYLYRDRRDRFECVYSLVNVFVFVDSDCLALHVEAFKGKRECFPDETIKNYHNRNH